MLLLNINIILFLVSSFKVFITFVGDRQIALVRELTKLHETVERLTLSSAAEFYSENAPKGEFVLIVEGKKEEIGEEMTMSQAVLMAKELMDKGMSASAAAKAAAGAGGFKKNDVYKELV